MTDTSPESAELQYQAFVEAIRTRQDVWALRAAEGLATWNSGEEGEPGTVPFWSAREQAEACAAKRFSGYSVFSISADEFTREYLLAIQEQGLFIGANMTDTMAGIDVRVDKLLGDIEI